MITHFLLFCGITLIASLVYHALRQDDLKAAIGVGLRRFVSFVVVAVVSGVVLLYFTRWL